MDAVNVKALQAKMAEVEAQFLRQSGAALNAEGLRMRSESAQRLHAARNLHELQ